ncbi:MAG: hypothetical protein ACKV0T_14820 [Planctomycetales bacterium]
MALDDVTRRLETVTGALRQAGIPFAIVGGQAVALWVASRDPAAVRTTKDVDLLIDKRNLAQVRKAARTIGWEYFEVLGVGMLLDPVSPNPRQAVHFIWANEKVRPEYPLPSPGIDETVELDPGRPVVSLAGLVRMKLMANRDQDRVHLRDMIEVGLIARDGLPSLPAELAERLEQLLTELGR